MSGSKSNRNQETYNRPDVAAHYALLDYLTACERHLFGQYIKRQGAILDLGVGGGRTTPFLSSRASRYVGVDYAPEMIRVCREKYPELEFLVGESADLASLESASFDAVVCAFNGLDYVVPDQSRVQCLKECYRILKPRGMLLFSSHNPRAVIIRPAWSRQRARRMAEVVSSPFSEGAYFLLNLAAGCRAVLFAAWASAVRIATRVPSRAFRQGEGYFLDPAHGGLLTHTWIPERVVAELERHKFRPLRILGDDYPAASGEHFTDWYYYVFSKSN